MPMQPKTIVIAGETASGKSALALWLAQNIPGGGEIVVCLWEWMCGWIRFYICSHGFAVAVA